MSKKLAEWVELEKMNTLVIGMGGTGRTSNVGASAVLEVSLTAPEAEAAVTFRSHWVPAGDLEVTAMCQLSVAATEVLTLVVVGGAGVRGAPC